MILQEIAYHTEQVVANLKTAVPLEQIKEDALLLVDSPCRNFKNSLSQAGISFICEVKKASPSVGVIDKDFAYLKIAEEYETAGASAISVLTERNFFLGHDDYLRNISANVSIPVLCKDFIIDSYQIYKAKVLGADAVLLICELLNEKTLIDFLALCRELKLDAVVESHSADEVKKAVEAGAEIIGVNNRDLTTFDVNLNTTLKLRNLVPNDKIFISESGISSPSDVKLLIGCHVDAVLVGSSLMKAENKIAKLHELMAYSYES